MFLLPLNHDKSKERGRQINAGFFTAHVRFLESQLTKLQSVSGSGRLERPLTRHDTVSIIQWLNDFSHSLLPGLNYSFCLVGMEVTLEIIMLSSVTWYGSKLWPRYVRLYNEVLLGLKPEPRAYLL